MPFVGNLRTVKVEVTWRNLLRAARVGHNGFFHTYPRTRLRRVEDTTTLRGTAHCGTFQRVLSPMCPNL